MSKIEVDTIDTVTGTTELTVGGTNATSVTVPTGVTTTLTDGVSGDFKMNSGYGSVATAYGCRAWVNFDGTGTVAIRGSGNVSSITDNGTGDYTVNLTTAMPDANYCVTSAEAGFQSSTGNRDMTTQILSASTISLLTYIPSTSASTDIEQIFSAVFR